MSEFRFPRLRGRRNEEASARRGTTEVVRADLALAWLSEAWGAHVATDAGVALGRALAGDRVSLWLREGAGRSLGTLGRAAATRVPLLGWAAIRDTAELPSLVATGAIVAVARSAQDLVDLSIELRWRSESTLLPALVAYEPSSLGRSIQDLVVPDLAEVHRIFGAPDLRRTSADRVEEALFGPTRTRVPGWFDFDRPLGTDGRGEGASGAAGRLAARLYLDTSARHSATQALSPLGIETAPVWVGGRTDDAVAVVVLGTLTEDLLATPEAGSHRIVAIRHLAPFPSEACARALEGARSISVWTAEGDPSQLALWVKTALREHGSDRAEVTHLTAGMGGLPLSPADVGVALGRLGGSSKKRGSQGLPAGTVIGWNLAPEEAARPHRDALHAALRRDHPETVARGLVGERGGVDSGSSPRRAVHLLARPGLSYLDEAGGLLHSLLGGTVRSREIETAMGSRELLVVLPVREPVDWIGSAGRPENADLLLPDDLAPALVSPRASEQGAVGHVASGQGAVGHVASEQGAVGHVASGDVPSGRVASGQVASVASVSGALVAPTEDEGGWRQDARVLGIILAELVARRPELAVPLGERPVRSLLAQRLQGLEPHERAQRTEALVGAMTERTSLLESGRAAADEAAAAGADGAMGRGVSRDDDPGTGAAGDGLVGAGAGRVGAGAGGVGGAGAGASPGRAWVRALSGEPPAALAVVKGDGSIIDPARAWHQAVRPWEEDGVISLVPEPGRIAGARPVLATAFLRSQPTPSSPVPLLPDFDLATCNGCAGCWSVCPESAIQAHADTPTKLFEQALDRAGSAAGPLRRGARQIGQTITRIAEESDGAAIDFAAAVRTAAFEWIEKSRPEETLRKELAASVTAVSAGVSIRGRTDTFFAPGLGKNRSLLSLAVDPDACTACGLCVVVCEPEAIRMTPPDGSQREAWSLLHSLADTPGAVIQAMEPVLGAVPARLLSRYVTQSFAGRRDVAGSLGALSVRWVVSSIEAVLQPRVIELQQSLASLSERLGERIRSQMAESLPVGDLDALAAAISGAGKDADLEALAHGLRTAESTGKLDGMRLARVVETARRIHDLRWKGETGSLGAGRARLGLVTTPGVDWISRFPAHPAFAPLRAETSEDAVGVWVGLVASHAERAGREAALRREAERLVTVRDAEPAAAESLRISWAEMTQEERRIVPPIVLVAREEELAPHLSALGAVLRNGGPAGVLALTEGDFVLSPWMLLAAAGEGASVVHSSAVRYDHLGAALFDLLEAGRPFLLRLLAPEPGESAPPRSAWDNAFARVASGAFPLFTYDPGRPFLESVAVDSHSLAEAPSRMAEAAWSELAPWIPVSEAEAGDAGVTSSPSPGATAADLDRVRRETEAALVERLVDRLAGMWRAQTPPIANGGVGRTSDLPANGSETRPE